MAQAICQNGECDRDEWTLTKHPSQYKRGPNCPECGTTKVEVVGAEPPEQPAAAAHGDERLPARSQQGSQQEAAVPARAGRLPDDESALAMGAQGAAILSGMDSEDPTERAQAYSSLMKTGGSLLAQYGQIMGEKKAQEAERAKNTHDDEIRVAQDYPSCPECGSQIQNIPEGQEFACPGCGTLLEHSPPG